MKIIKRGIVLCNIIQTVNNEIKNCNVGEMVLGKNK